MRFSLEIRKKELCCADVVWIHQKKLFLCMYFHFILFSCYSKYLARSWLSWRSGSPLGFTCDQSSYIYYFANILYFVWSIFIINILQLNVDHQFSPSDLITIQSCVPHFSRIHAFDIFSSQNQSRRKVYCTFVWAEFENEICSLVQEDQ